MKKIIYVLLLIPFLGFSQSYRIEYKVKSFIMDMKGVLTLPLSEKETPYYSEVVNESSASRRKEGNRYIYTAAVVNPKKKYQIYDKKKDTILSITYLAGKRVVYSEKMPMIQWKIHHETKVISNFICKKAVATFRSKTYTAWFTTAIPGRFGPWKFNNLPGLILQVYDNTQEYTWNVSKITFVKETEKLSIENQLKLDTISKKMSLKEYRIKMYDNSMNKKSPFEAVLMNRGIKMGGKIQTQLNKREVFEWEVGKPGFTKIKFDK